MAHHFFPWKEAFLNALRHRPVLGHAAKIVGITRETAWRARQADEEFNTAVKEALEEGIDRSEAEAFARGTDGWEEPVIHQGELAFQMEPILNDDGELTFTPTGRPRMRLKLDAQGNRIPLTVRKFSDQLLIATLRAHREGYRTERTELTSPDGSMSPDRTAREARIAQIAAAAQARKLAAENAKPEDFA